MKFIIKLILIVSCLVIANGFVCNNKPTGMLDLIKTRIELYYDQERKELQIKVEGKEQIELVQIYAGEKLLVEFDNQQIPPWDSIIRLKMGCPLPCKFCYIIQTNDGMRHNMKSKKTDLNENGSFCEIGSPKKN
ncbi:hypothetical protein [Cytophaga hutchinsonii]|uniref:Uncharacterized protein n=1 Tax=Cytophaga hutchinsonii (strain ATCC 33406 / DSM 1761 / CIP 103989 / NBRC 15051 / NCIMB 9469 / D465) TaxID=269798 RepID=A0A6N4SM67_CYTH3|nr:hypothetical protein [Cytophaga hutchinsonii]ABG57342.1 hypothetical protein CHU_0048 [Cytophaga hutchinsonii ATCC 33406]SFX46752.1 hypothetical protein SAMN04487930_104240 [Cytophaga hutchinsonii ATCC 33406]